MLFNRVNGKCQLMIQVLRRFYLLALILLFCGAGCFNGKPSSSFFLKGRGSSPPSHEKYTEQKALGVIRNSRATLAPIYTPLAEQIVSDFDLSKKDGIGIDLGSGPGTLILELCKRTKLHWVNADINPHFFPYFYRQADELGFGHRVSAIFADAHILPFRDNYADIIISRGSFHFWEDKVKAFGEIYRVLKPGASAYIGRGLSRNLPVETAAKIHTRGGKMNYDADKTDNELSYIMKALGIKEWKIHRPKPPGSENIYYGVWIEFHKPKSSEVKKQNE